MNGDISNVMFHHSSNEPVSVKKNDIISQITNNKKAGKSISNSTVLIWFSVLKLCIH
jgi:hypothetical protein